MNVRLQVTSVMVQRCTDAKKLPFKAVEKPLQLLKYTRDCPLPKNVNVLPALVTPYVKSSEFSPSRTSLTKSFTVPSNSSLCVVSGP